MSGRAYTMREMSSIVDYVNKRKAYGEIKGRKLWTDFASSNLTNRTWQSLKETFLKRILPDIHNPYFGLTKSEICSFKQGYDVEARIKNKLDIHTISDESNHSNAGNVQDSEKPSTSYNKEAENSTGEIVSPSTLNARTRASTETIILENCYENAEDIQRDLESPIKEKDTENPNETETPNNRLRDLITYAEPFTPMMQQVLDDFATEDEMAEEELVEAELEILEGINNRNEKNCNKNNSKIDKDKDQTNKTNEEKSTEKVYNRLSEVVQCSESIKIPLGQESKVPESNTVGNNTDLTDNGNVKDDIKKKDEISYSLDKKEKNKNYVDLSNDTATQNTNNSTDTIIPENQEALNNKNENTGPEIVADALKEVSKKLSLSRKRSFSLNMESNLEKKRKLGSKSKDVTQSEAEDKNENNTTTHIGKNIEKKKGNDEHNPQSTNNTQNIEENKAAGSFDGKFSQINPCLNSVSLYDEQFNNTKYTDSDSSDNLVINAIVEVHKDKKDIEAINVENDKNIGEDHKEKTDDCSKEKAKEIQNKGDDENSNEKLLNVFKKAENINEVVILKSHSESDDSNEAENGDIQVKPKQVDKKDRQEALAKMFGFSSGVVSSDRKRKLNRVHHSSSYKLNASNSSDWTSDSESEYVSPPRGRRNRYARKYLKPRPARILQLEEDGGLFVMHGKKIYPLVNDGSVVKNYLAFSPESGPEEDSAYWKKKYKEERKKTEELKKLVEASIKLPAREQSPMLPTSSRQSAQETLPELIPIADELALPSEKPKLGVKSNEKTLKIKFSKNNEELQVEGVWSQIHPVLADVVQIFSKEPEPKEALPSNTNGKSDIVKSDVDEIVSIRSTPLDEDAIRKKVDKMEEEIFNKIEELDKSEREQEASVKDQESSEKDQEANVNKRKRIGRPRKSSTALKSADSSSSPGRPKRTKANKPTAEDQKEVGKVNGHSKVEVDKENVQKAKKEMPKRRTRTPKKYNSESSAASEKSKKSPKSVKSTNPEPESTRLSTEDDDVRYMFPPEKTRRSYSKTAETKARSSNIPTNPTTENLSLNSIESSQGYQDSDLSPAKERIMLKRRRKLGLTVLNKGKQRRFIRRRSYPCISDDASSESSNLSFKIPMKNTSASLKSEVYRSESYQLLMPAKKSSYTNLEKIDECPSNNNCMNDNDTLKIHVDTFEMKNSSSKPDVVNIRSEGNSSNITLPLSPELSIVENISVNKELLDSVEDLPTINEMQANDEPNLSIDNKYLMSAVDITMPLMEQDCDIQKSVSTHRPEYEFDQANSAPFKKIDSSNVTEGRSISDSLGCRFGNLLLESAKKMEVDMLETVPETGNIIPTKKVINKKSRAKNRCSTPHKKNSKKNSKVPDIAPVVEEERMEFCSYGGRKSCPPILPDFIHTNDNEFINVTDNEPLKKRKKKKDVIKVKILKPNNKQKKAVPAEVKKTDVTTISVHTDSGINETNSALFLQDSDDSVDLIHNHSETCLQTKECFGDSIEVVERDTSIISINSVDAMLYLPPEVYCNNACDGANTIREKVITSQSTSETVYLSPLASELSANSLITEDLSEENEAPNPRLTNKWYLLSEDETTNTNHVPSFGANLNHIFPVTCTVPDLSTITEMSKENDSRKPTLDTDGDTRNDLESQSMF
ncbi:ras guanine nucleotide exchange factor Y-like isoform X2 [Plodia interpunctella]|uniref:ras guanine nucleotide exchange factor Y-like isoform X2 n=1 Tax=Plodia interpunctella TaxID=58824 RepID=UPI002368B959|nr:ras guanine nucleotide exchange factor Y-like isoform X2 [Plodia interpunctella]